MFRLILVCFLLTLTVGLGLAMHQEVGLVVLAWKHTTVEMPLWLAALMILISFILFYIMIRFIVFIFSWRKIGYRAQSAWKLRQMAKKEAARLALERQVSLVKLEVVKLLAAVSASEVMMLWKKIPSHYHYDIYCASVYVKALVLHREYKLAEKFLRGAINSQWQAPWLRLYGLIEHIHPGRSLSTAEGWVKLHAEDPLLFLTLGRLALKAELWSKAAHYLELSINLNPEPEAYAELGRLYERLEKIEQSHDCYRKGLLLLSNQEALGVIAEL